MSLAEPAEPAERKFRLSKIAEKKRFSSMLSAARESIYFLNDNQPDDVDLIALTLSIVETWLPLPQF